MSHLINLNCKQQRCNCQLCWIPVSLHTPQLREHLAKGQRTLAGEGMSQIVRSLLELLQRRSYYSGDLLFSTEILRNVTDTFKRATYIPAPDDVQVRVTNRTRRAVTDTHSRTLATPANVFSVGAPLSTARGVHNNELQRHSCCGLKGDFLAAFFSFHCL